MGSTLTPENLPGGRAPQVPKGHDLRSLGPTDSSDSGSDVAGSQLTDDDLSALDMGEEHDAESPDINTDRVVTAAEAGLGGGLDQAEEAQLGITDEQLEDEDEDGRPRERH